MLDMTKVELEVISDSDMYLLFGKDKKEGVSYISKRYSKANNKYLKSYDLKWESKHIIYLEYHNLYGYSMARFFQQAEFKWIDTNNFDLKKVEAIVQQVVFQKLILNYLKNYGNYILIIF